MGIGGGSKPKPPKAAPPPPMPVTMEDPAVRAAKEAELQRQQKMRGRRSTILAGAAEGQRNVTLGGQ
jgi:hypothetical protein